MTIKETILNAVATASLLGAGTTVIGLKLNDARQDQRIERLEELDAHVSGLRDDLNRVDKHLSNIDGQLQQQQDIDHHGER